MPLVKANGLDIYYEDEGEGRPVLFIHGGFGGAESTLFPKRSAIYAALPRNAFRTISFDRRSCGRSSYVLDETTLEDLAADARYLLEALEIETALIVGDSLGGMVALRVALDYPDAVEGLVLLETSARIMRRTRQVRAALLALRLLGPRAVYRLFRRRFLEPDWSKPVGPASSEAELRRAEAHNHELRRRLGALPDDELYRYSLGLVRTYVAFSGRDLRGEVSRLNMPVRVVHGSADTVIRPHHGRELASLIPAATFTELPRLGHGLLYFPEGREALRTAVGSASGEVALARGSP